MGCSDDLCNAGLFHSFYGTEFFNPKLEVDRLKLVDIIGYKAEQIVYDFCQLKDRDEFLLKNNLTKPSTPSASIRRSTFSCSAGTRTCT